MKAEYETTINALLAENDKLIKLVDWQNDEIERLREALRGISTRNFPEGTATLELRKLARAALGEKE